MPYGGLDINELAQAAELLGVKGTLDEKGLRQAYRDFAHTWHPDVAAKKGISAEEANKKMMDGNKAQSLLKKAITNNGGPIEIPDATATTSTTQSAAQSTTSTAQGAQQTATGSGQGSAGQATNVGTKKKRNRKRRNRATTTNQGGTTATSGSQAGGASTQSGSHRSTATNTSATSSGYTGGGYQSQTASAAAATANQSTASDYTTGGYQSQETEQTKTPREQYEETYGGIFAGLFRALFQPMTDTPFSQMGLFVKGLYLIVLWIEFTSVLNPFLGTIGRIDWSGPVEPSALGFAIVGFVISAAIELALTRAVGGWFIKLGEGIPLLAAFIDLMFVCALITQFAPLVGATIPT